MNKQTVSSPLHWYDYLFMNANWFGLTLRSQVLAGLLVPLLVQQFVGEDQKGAYFGTIRLWGLMSALLLQALFGIVSDHSRSKWGRRRPFILIGIMLESVLLLSIAWVAGLTGMSGYYVLFAIYMISMASTNMSQAATQGFIPDIVPQEKRGIASGLKTMLEIPFPLILFGLVIAPMVQKGNLTGGLIMTVIGLLVCLVLSMFVREKQLETTSNLDWKPFFSLFLMTAVFTIIILGLGKLVQLLILPVQTSFSEAGSRWVFGALGVVAMLIAVVVGVFASLRVQMGRKLAADNQPFTWWVINRLAALVAINNIGTFLLYFIQEKFNLPGKQAAGLAGTLPLVLGVCVIIFGLVAGWLSCPVTMGLFCARRAKPMMTANRMPVRMPTRMTSGSETRWNWGVPGELNSTSAPTINEPMPAAVRPPCVGALMSTMNSTMAMIRKIRPNQLTERTPIP